MTISAKFGSAQAGLGYQFLDATAALLGSRVTAGILATPETGTYLADVTLPAGAVGVYWNSDAETATEFFAESTGGGSGLTPGTVAALEAAEQILLADLYVPTPAPVVVVPAPVSADVVTVYLDSQEITGTIDTNLVINLGIVGQPLLAVGNFLSGQEKPMIHQTDTPGQYRIDLPRNTNFLATSSALFGADGIAFLTPDLATYNLNLAV